MVARGKTLSTEQRQKLAEEQVVVKQAARIVGLPINSTVRVDTPRELRYHGKVGTVVSHNQGEVGVSFGGTIAVWFLPATLIRVQR